MSTAKSSVLFVCVHNAGRSQMAAAYLQHLSEGQIEVRSAGSIPADQVNPAAVEAMREEGIDISAAPQDPYPRSGAELGGGDHHGLRRYLPNLPGKRYEDWKLDEPAGQGVETVRSIRDEICARIETLISELLPLR